MTDERIRDVRDAIAIDKEARRLARLATLDEVIARLKQFDCDEVAWTHTEREWMLDECIAAVEAMKEGR